MTNKLVDEWELHDIGRTLCSPIEGLYECVEQFAHKFYSTQRADELVQSSRLREERGTTPQQDFSDFCNIWVKTIEGGDFQLKPKASQAELVIPGTVVYKDAVEYLVQAKKHGMKIGVLTSGTLAFNVHMLKAALPEPVVIGGGEGRSDSDGKTIDNLADLVDRQFRGEEWGDKDQPESLNRIYDELAKQSGTAYIVFDDKITVCEAVLSAYDRKTRVVLMDREGKCQKIPNINNPFRCHEDELKALGTFDELSDKQKKVVRLHSRNGKLHPYDGGLEFPRFEVDTDYSAFLRR